MNSPAFSIIIPCYNAGELLQQTLNSVYAQSFCEYEIIAVNDGSTDDTDSILKKQSDVRFRFISQPNSGVSIARNNALLLAKGKYVIFLDADDIWHPDHLQQAYHFMEDHLDVNWYASGFYALPEPPDKWSKESLYPKIKIVNYFINQTARCIAPSNAVIRRSAIHTKDFFPPSIKYAEDTIAWARFALSSPCIAINLTKTSLYRQHSTSVTWTKVYNINQSLYKLEPLLTELIRIYGLNFNNANCKKYCCRVFVSSIFYLMCQFYHRRQTSIISRKFFYISCWTFLLVSPIYLFRLRNLSYVKKIKSFITENTNTKRDLSMALVFMNEIITNPTTPIPFVIRYYVKFFIMNMKIVYDFS